MTSLSRKECRLIRAIPKTPGLGRAILKGYSPKSGSRAFHQEGVTSRRPKRSGLSFLTKARKTFLLRFPW